jgi:hypothetical protein
MADPGTDQLVVVIVAFVIAVVGAAFFEVRFLRKKMRKRRTRIAKRDDELQDSAHNAIVTTKAILSSLERQGIQSGESSALLDEAQAAYERRNYRVAVELTGKAKDRLLAVKAARASQGDLVKLEQLSKARSGESDAITTKELLQKEMPPNMVQSKFSIEVAGTAIERGRAAGRDVSQASQLLETAQARFDSKDYAGALSIARQTKRLADGEAIEVSIPAPVSVPTQTKSSGPGCPSCGAPLRADDAFCPKCGTRIASPTCSSCGASLLTDDAFCRKCGAPVSR